MVVVVVVVVPVCAVWTLRVTDGLFILMRHFFFLFFIDLMHRWTKFLDHHERKKKQNQFNERLDRGRYHFLFFFSILKFLYFGNYMIFVLMQYIKWHFKESCISCGWEMQHKRSLTLLWFHNRLIFHVIHTKT